MSGTIFDVSDIESIKENMKPLKEGRSSKSLCQIVHGQLSEEQIEKERKQHEKRIKKYTGEDPLSLWIEYILWIKTTFPTGNSKSGLLGALERCFKAYYDGEEYKEDLRYLKICLQYGDMIKEPLELYNFLENRGIGLKSYLYWCARGYYHEMRQEWDLADKCYQRGVEHGAEPQDIMKSIQVEFQSRMLKVITESMSSTKIEEPKPAKKPLTSLRQRTGQGLSRGLPKSRVQPSVKKVESNSMPIYEDTPQDKQTLVESARLEWVNFADEMTKYKENVLRPTKWTEFTQPQDSKARLAANRLISKSYGVAKPAEFTVFVDDEFEDESK